MFVDARFSFHLRAPESFDLSPFFCGTTSHVFNDRVGEGELFQVRVRCFGIYFVHHRHRDIQDEQSVVQLDQKLREERANPFSLIGLLRPVTFVTPAACG